MLKSKRFTAEHTPSVTVQIEKRVIWRDARPLSTVTPGNTIGHMIDAHIRMAVEDGEVIDTLSISFESADWDEVVRQFGEYSSQRAV